MHTHNMDYMLLGTGTTAADALRCYRQQWTQTLQEEGVFHRHACFGV